MERGQRGLKRSIIIDWLDKVEVEEAEHASPAEQRLCKKARRIQSDDVAECSQPKACETSSKIPKYCSTGQQQLSPVRTNRVDKEWLRAYKRLPRPWASWEDESGGDQFAWLPDDVRKGLEKVDDPWLYHSVLLTTWRSFTKEHCEELRPDRGKMGRKLILSSTVPEKPTTTNEPCQIPEAPSIPNESDPLPIAQSLTPVVALALTGSQDSGYMSDVVASPPAKKETIIETIAEAILEPQEKEVTKLISEQEPSECTTQPTRDSLPPEEYCYTVTLLEPGALKVQTICSFQARRLGKANDFAMQVFRRYCDFRLPQPQLMLGRGFEARCRRSEAIKWFSCAGTAQYAWCTAQGEHGRVAVDRKSNEVSGSSQT